MTDEERSSTVSALPVHMVLRPGTSDPSTSISNSTRAAAGIGDGIPVHTATATATSGGTGTSTSTSTSETASETNTSANTDGASSTPRRRLRSRLPFGTRAMQSLLSRGKAFLTPSGSSTSLASTSGGAKFRTEKSATGLFAVTDPAVDGEECLRDCASCTAELPRKWSIDEDDKLYGHVKGWDTHLVVATGKTDWVRDVTDEKGSLMQEVGELGLELKNGKVMLSASDMPVTSGDDEEEEEDHHTEEKEYRHDGRTRCLLLPRWEMVEGVGRSEAKWLLEEMLAKGASNQSPLEKKKSTTTNTAQTNGAQTTDGEVVVQKEDEMKETNGTENSEPGMSIPQSTDGTVDSVALSYTPKPPGVRVEPCPHQAIILMCSHGTRDWRCGKSAPLLRREFERHLRPLGLYRDIHDERPGGVGIYFINHVGGHKYSANVMIYRRQGRKEEGTDEEIDGAPLSSEAVQGIWLARVRPEDCENIVKYTILQGKLVKPQRQLRGGFDREKGVMSW